MISCISFYLTSSSLLWMTLLLRLRAFPNGPEPLLEINNIYVYFTTFNFSLSSAILSYAGVCAFVSSCWRKYWRMALDRSSVDRDAKDGIWDETCMHAPFFPRQKWESIVTKMILLFLLLSSHDMEDELH